MFSNRNDSLVKPIEFGDSAVEGLFNGMLAGFIMEIYLTLSGIGAGLPLAGALNRISPIRGLTPAGGVLLHFAVSGIYGMVFWLAIAVLSRRPALRPFGWLAGLVYGGLLLAAAALFILPNTDSALREIPRIHFIAAHLLYGLVLGLRTTK